MCPGKKELRVHTYVRARARARLLIVQGEKQRFRPALLLAYYRQQFSLKPVFLSPDNAGFDDRSATARAYLRFMDAENPARHRPWPIGESEGFRYSITAAFHRLTPKDLQYIPSFY